MIKLF